MVFPSRRTSGKVKPLRRLSAAQKRFLSLIPKRLAKLRPRPQLPIVPYSRPAKIYGSLGNLEVRLARTRGDLRRAQKLRYQVFYEEMAAVPGLRAKLSRRDEDKYDQICDHLLVVDKGPLPDRRKTWLRRPRVVGTYRLLRQEMAERHGGFYTQSEYDIAPLVATKRATHSFVELGRSCVLKPYRNKRTVELLWHGLWTYVRENGGDVMIGCASFPGVEPKDHALALSFLHHHARAPEAWRVKAHPKLFVDMNMMKADEIDMKAAIKTMPPLIKGYLRLGAYVGDGAVIDRQFGTTDVLIILPIEAIDPRYFTHFGAPDETMSELGR
jgi:putative hemolysin